MDETNSVINTTTEVLRDDFLGNDPQQWLAALGITAAVFLGLFLLRRILGTYLGKIVKNTAIAWDDIVVALVPRTHWLFLFSLALLAGSRPLELSEATEKLLLKSVAVLSVIQLGIWANTLVSYFLEDYRKRKAQDDPASATTISAVGLLIRISIWAVVLLLALANAGVQIAPLLAGLGVGGIAVALAVQTVLKDLLASLSIILDKPFVLGDFLIVGDLMGAVEHIGLKTTRIRSLSGEQLIFANGDLLESRIRNFGRMKERRVVFKLGITYQTPKSKIEKVPGIIKAAIEAEKTARFDRSHFNEYGNFSLNFETVYYVAVPDYNTYMNIQQAINLRIHEDFEKEGIEFAYPTQTLFVMPPEAKRSAPRKRARSPRAHADRGDTQTRV